MNSADLHLLLAAPPVSRAAFFTKLLVEPVLPGETQPDEPATDSAPVPAAPPAAPAEPSAAGFPA
ncbi:hypothetical protein MON38_03900 [Hymenobacter sp. DH14]|uniref:Uncharacterized protein n=1 Tax=Hymenobacter cyanobacteriorum TaxID=2926463 RepID=A0A9X2AFJ1_9BACT|nr:hypothetical protein [Hymenobacter cyanobacteriorum]MCI1186548.1 hypothetical protein [Hymenobacter cyanobacteriorum]